MRRKALTCALSLLTAGWLLAPAADAAPGDKGKPKENIKTDLRSLDEVPVVLSGASGELLLSIDEAAGTIAYDLFYEDLEGTVTQAHIHIGRKNQAGGIAIWLCQTQTNPAPAAVANITPFCPTTNPGEVSGTLTAANVIAVNQAVPAGAPGFADVITAIRKGLAYGNVHSSVATGGEIRGQLH